MTEEQWLAFHKSRGHKTPQELLKAGTHQHCPICSEKHVEAYNEYGNVSPVIWPKPLQEFSEAHVDENDTYICNYHGRPEFNPEHDCLRNECG